MAIIKEFHSERTDGVKLYKIYSASDVLLRQVETGHLYSVAVDVEGSPYTYEETDMPVEREPVKYSTLKIIRTLGDEWLTYKAQAERAGVLDQFYAANYLASDDPVFSAFLENVPVDVKAKLDQCIWEGNE